MDIDFNTKPTYGDDDDDDKYITRKMFPCLLTCSQ